VAKQGLPRVERFATLFAELVKHQSVFARMIRDSPSLLGVLSEAIASVRRSSFRIFVSIIVERRRKKLPRRKLFFFLRRQVGDMRPHVTPQGSAAREALAAELARVFQFLNLISFH